MSKLSWLYFGGHDACPIVPWFCTNVDTTDTKIALRKQLSSIIFFKVYVKFGLGFKDYNTHLSRTPQWWAGCLGMKKEGMAALYRVFLLALVLSGMTNEQQPVWCMRGYRNLIPCRTGHVMSSEYQRNTWTIQGNDPTFRSNTAFCLWRVSLPGDVRLFLMCNQY